MAEYNNVSWTEGNLWYGWVYNERLNRYHFDDIGHESIIKLWEYFWEREDDVQENQM